MATKASNIAQAARTVDASGNVDGDTLDNLDSSQFLRSDTDDTFTGQLTISHSGTIGPDGSLNTNAAYVNITDSSASMWIDPNQIVANDVLNFHSTVGDIRFYPASGSFTRIERGGLIVSSGNVNINSGELWVLNGTDDGLRIRAGVDSASTYAITGTVNNAVVFTNEQGTTNQAIILNDAPTASTDDVFAIAQADGASTPSSGTDAWQQLMAVNASGALSINGGDYANGLLTAKQNSDTATGGFTLMNSSNGKSARIYVDNSNVIHFAGGSNDFMTVDSSYNVDFPRSAGITATDITATTRLQVPTGTTVDRPAFGDAGAVYWNQTNNSLDVSNGTDWLSISFSNYRGYLDNVDVETPSGAYSLRKLTRAYSGPCIQVTDGSVNQDIYFTEDGDLDTNAIETFAASVSTTALGVRIWYDQSGNGKHAIQTNSANRPKIFNVGSIVRAANGKPALYYDGGDYLNIADQISSGYDTAAAMVFQCLDNSEHYIYSGGYDDNFPTYAANLLFMSSNGLGNNDGFPSATTVYAPDIIHPTYPASFIYQYLYAEGTKNMYSASGTNVSSASCGQSGAQRTIDHQIGWAVPRNKATAYTYGYIQEIIYWGDSGLRSQVQNSFDDINEYWNISGAIIPSSTASATSSFDAATNEVVHTISASTNVEVVGSLSASKLLMVAGGGGGGVGNTASSLAGGGGGAGGLIYQTNYGLTAGTKPITVGAGGAGAIGPNTDSGGDLTGFPEATGANGGNSTFNGLTAVGGGGGGTRNAYEQGKDGGSGGGHAGTSVGRGGYGTAGQGNDGSSNISSSSAWHAGGGGGAGAQAADYSGSSWFCGDGGNGLTYDISGTSVTYAGGGGGGDHFDTATGVGSVPGDGGTGGGGDGAAHPAQQSAGSGTDGLGGGGGGAHAYNGSNYGTQYAGDGGDGIVIIRHTVG